MKIALCSSIVPFIFGGARNIVDWLELKLLAEGHQVEKVYLPHVEYPNRLFNQAFSFRWIDLSEADRVICFRPPSHFIRHPKKILWFIHHIRIFYDLWDSPYRYFPTDSYHCALRDSLRDADTQMLREASAIFTNSAIVGRRLKEYNGIDSEVLYPPLYDSSRFHNKGFNDEVIYVCRLEHHKRQHLLVEAMKFTKTPVRLRICGAGSNDVYPTELLELVQSSNLQDRVTIENAWITEEQKINYLSECLAAAYLPLDEDSYGYPTLEAAFSSKPILTTTDSGGVLEFVQNQVNGLVCEPTPEALAEALDRLYLDRKTTLNMGQAARDRINELDITWTRVLNRLLA